MAVNVHRASSGKVITHEEGVLFAIRDGGHLIVMDGKFNDSNAVAVYAPGAWAYAVVEVSAD